MADYMPIILLGGVAIGGFLLWQSGALSNLFTPPAAPAPAAPYPTSGVSSTVSGVSSTSTTPSAMGTDLITGQPCPCSSAVGGTILHHHYKRVKDSKGREQILIIPSALGGASSSTCQCGGASSILGGSLPSQFTSVGDLNNFIGSSIAQAAYHLG